jgi:hypothetical protein
MKGEALVGVQDGDWRRLLTTSRWGKGQQEVTKVGKSFVKIEDCLQNAAEWSQGEREVMST